MADEWYMDLTDNNKKTWNDIKKAFRKRWLRKKQVKKTDDEYEDKIMRRKLKTEDLGKMEKVAGREVYIHIAWADKMATSVKGAKWAVLYTAPLTPVKSGGVHRTPVVSHFITFFVQFCHILL